MKKRVLFIFLCMLMLCGCAHSQVLNEQGSEMQTASEDNDASGIIGSEAGDENSIENDALFEAYPDADGWMEQRDYGDIPMLADADYITTSLATGTFLVSTPEELASFCYIVNTSQSGQGLSMQLQNDIDLAGYQWTSMGWSGGDGYLPFTCSVDGNGYTIRNMTIDCDDSSVGFIGWETSCTVSDITFENANVSGNTAVGIVTGQAIGGWYENCHVTGAVNGYQAGSLLGYSATSDVFNCTADVTVNDETFEFLTWNDKEKSEIVIENPITIVLHDDYTITRPPIKDYDNMSWLVKKDDVVVLQRNADDELYYRYTDTSPGVYAIYLEAFVDGQYVPISNTVEYIIE